MTDPPSPISVARAVAVHLAGWRAVVDPECDRWADLVHERTGARLRVSVGGWRLDGRIVFRGVWPRFRDGTPYVYRSTSEGAAPHATVAQERAPASIAADISRRLLPSFLALHDAAMAYVRAQDGAVDEAELVARRLGTVREESHRRPGNEVRFHAGLEATYRTAVRPAWGSSVSGEHPLCVDLELRGLAPDVAAEVLRVVRAGEATRSATPKMCASRATPRRMRASTTMNTSN